MDWSCYFLFVSTPLLTGYGLKVTQCYIGRTHEMLYFTEGLLHCLSMFSPTRISARVLLTWIFRCVRLGARSWRIPPPQDVCDWSLEDTLEIVLSRFYSSPAIWLESSFVLVRYPNT